MKTPSLLALLVAIVIGIGVGLPGCGFDLDGDAPDGDAPEAPPPPPKASIVVQGLTACLGDGGLHVTCYATDWPGPCAQISNCNPTGYCPESTSTETAYCDNPGNCSRPEYGMYCTGLPCPNGTPHSSSTGA